MFRFRVSCLQALAWSSAILLGACAESAPAPAPSFGRFSTPGFHPTRDADDTSAVPGLFLRGTAKVISVDQALGYALLEVDGRRVEAYWQTEVAAAQGGAVTQADPVRPGVGVYRPPDVRVQPLLVKPGDTIAFLGMRTGSSIFLQGVAVIGR